ncbi:MULTISPECIES: hypothetical protein [unclassified Polaromonas]|jgi:hypothetical protein|uniref:hypothetical protein n=1 Tax=unclassified Polaromonas TaxID=2638319 RepID=UPI000BDAA887|nr:MULTISPECIES: hypothetical protein [unclassified Polaromonas]OYZ79709.1 MAG: hypothetical protein B7Y09_09305 [Polaromonas sp. 24-63-21]OZA47289.1 MAG: hypothetical protein B7X88_22575 [Polaromonas sp. 17-63-33]HQS00779.1 hypothetical protein [Polaromonas sp.]HQS38960.1 hypothetical protein [Polaromonas sp.]HQT09669.1 hypothetical protein [Polaromonas sp.]
MELLAAPATPDPVSGQPAAPAERVKPEPDELAKTWNKRIASARKHWEKFHKRVQHNRSTVAGFDWSKDPKEKEFYKLRANLIHGTITAILPNIYAKNPEISASSTHKGRNLKLLCKTLETVTNRYLEQADLKNRAKSSVRAALTCSFGVVKVMYQRDIREDPIIRGRIQDTQDNILAAEGLLADVTDPSQRGDLEAKRAELEQMMASLNAKVEVTAAEGLVIDRVLTDNLIVDPGVCEFWDYKDGDWITQVIPMKRSAAEAQYNMLLASAKGYDAGEGQMTKSDNRFASGGTTTSDDQMIAVLEIWDKRSNTVFTMAEGCDYWLREPYSPPKAGERWYPFFLLPFNVVDGQFVGPSMVDLTEKLQEEHNDARNAFNKHRDLCKPGWIGSSDINEKSIKRYTDSEIGEITILDLEGKPLSQVIIPRQHPAIDPQVYDTSAVRYDWEQVTGTQDAARGSVVNAKTATEASIMQQSLSGRVSEFRDGVEDWLQEVARYSAQILMMELTPQQVERIMGPPLMRMSKNPADPMGGMVETPEKQYDWPELSREEVFDMIEMKIRAGTTSAPDKLEQQESWTKVLPIIKELVMTIGQLQTQGLDAEPYINMLRETLARFDERLDVEQFLPKPPQMPAPALPGGMPGLGGPQVSPPVMQ